MCFADSEALLDASIIEQNFVVLNPLALASQFL